MNRSVHVPYRVRPHSVPRAGAALQGTALHVRARQITTLNFSPLSSNGGYCAKACGIMTDKRGQSMTGVQVSLWATRRWRLVYRLLRAVPASEAERYVVERNEWQQRISDACEATWTELHGGSAVIYGTLDECVQRVERLTRFRREASGG